MRRCGAYHDIGQEPSRCDVGIAFGSRDLDVPIHTAELYKQGLLPCIVFTGGNSRFTIDRFPRGEAVHYREYAITLGVPADVIRIETNATNTSENLTNTRQLLADEDIRPASVMLISRPYHLRRVYATCRKVWPEVDVVCSAQPLALDEYVASVGDADRVINLLVGYTQRITEYARRGFAIEQDVPQGVHASYERLVAAGFTSRLI